jgi:hypothetical protein
MSEQKPIVGDLLGLQPYAETVRDTTKSIVGGVGALLSRICLPAAEELGLAFKDRVSAYRSQNLDAIAAKAEEALVRYHGSRSVKVHPRIAAAIIGEGAWTDDSLLQGMWGGLLASSCKPDDPDDQSLIYINMLKQLTSLEVRILNLACVRLPKTMNTQGLIFATETSNPECIVDLKQLMALVGCNDIHVLDRDLDHLRSLSLIYNGLELHPDSPEAEFADITPTVLALNMYVACQGYTGTAGTYFNVPVVQPFARNPDEPHFIRPAHETGGPAV